MLHPVSVGGWLTIPNKGRFREGTVSYNKLISDKLEVEKELGILLDKGIQGSGRMALEQADKITSGFTRLTWYSFCFFDNYKDVCSNLAHEDVRFAKALINLGLKPNVIFKIIQVLVKDILAGSSEEQTDKIHLMLLKKGASFACSKYTKEAFTYTIANSIYSSFGMRIAIDSLVTKVSRGAVAAFSIYDLVNTAAKAAARLKERKPFIYKALYHAEIEMLYFIVEPIFSKIDTKHQLNKSDKQIASG